MLIMHQLTAVLALLFCAQAFMEQTFSVCTHSEKISQTGLSFEGGRADG